MTQVTLRSELLMVPRLHNVGGEEVIFGDYPTQTDRHNYNKEMESGVTTSIL